MNDMQKIREALPEGWKVVHGEESFGALGHLGIVIIVHTTVDVSEETKSTAGSSAYNISNNIQKDVLRSQFDFERNLLQEKNNLLYQCLLELLVLGSK